MVFKKATRKNVKIKLAITGPAGSGKTMSAIKLAKGLCKKVVVIDTENSSASNYSDLDFDTATIEAPYNPQKLINLIDDAVKENYECIIIDSLSHFWAGEGGVLDAKSEKDARGGNSYTNWSDFTKLQNKMIEKIMNCNAHVICTMRSKTEYVMQENEKGKMSPRKVGLAPIQRDGVEYEYSIVFDVAMNHTAQTSKDRTGLFTDQIFLIENKHGEIIRKWLDGGEAVSSKEEKQSALRVLVDGIKNEEKKHMALSAINAGQGLDAIEKRINEILKEQGAK